jgi:glycerol-3-phosphate acyltransferase PlsY
MSGWGMLLCVVIGYMVLCMLISIYMAYDTGYWSLSSIIMQGFYIAIIAPVLVPVLFLSGH